ncbi:8-amino-7-oxononanoate synthase [Candidatus Pantoea edessiphila]|uniref:8-amino-7-oxononanoate synthase n=1 Tax=Candidatus Pantoea edessiphila TaxID=2044610 RepID=A0A2P5SZ02_9GAMM|nr:8-amino-7-oxononanoate synthase [Candidatus Pantoea edessiphila]MBK4775308.1 8-amino-7-oxononanoate synthase [Pantoea sp. Edef]PPI87555.1 8-amino-7-oxononanoate synthase [Candidatus Pantoea edessiphila]
MSWEQRIHKYLSIQMFTDKWRERYIIDENNTRLLRVGKKIYINFSSNDYLGLNRHPLIIKSWNQGMSLAGVGASASGHITGFSKYHADLEMQIADWLGYSRALLFISGFNANQAVINLLAKKNDHIIADKLIHASLVDAVTHSPAKLYRFNHNIMESLMFYLNISCAGEKLVLTEGIFSMDGDKAPLKIIYKTAQESKSWLLVDDSHGIGIIGDEGRGSCWSEGVKPELLTISFSKAFGISGGALLCEKDTADYFLQFSKHLIYSTCMPPAQAFALQTALNLVKKSKYLRYRLNENIKYFQMGIKSTPWKIISSNSAIQPLIIGDICNAKVISMKLAKAGCWVNVIKPPTVLTGTTRIRITLSAVHKFEDIDILLEALNHAAR